MYCQNQHQSTSPPFKYNSKTRGAGKREMIHVGNDRLTGTHPTSQKTTALNRLKILKSEKGQARLAIYFPLLLLLQRVGSLFYVYLTTTTTKAQ